MTAKDLEVYGVENLKQVIGFLTGEITIEPIVVIAEEEFYANVSNFNVDFPEVKGQENVKRALEVSAAGGHNIIMIGPPGAGKTMLSKLIPTILPPLTLQEALETTKIHSAAGKMGKNSSLMTTCPYSSPHHTISDEIVLLYVV